MKALMIGSLVLSMIAAAVYFLMAANVISVPNLNPEEAPAAIPYTAGGCYLVGGLLILIRKRWLWTTGLVINTLVIAIFFMAYNQKPDIMFSLPGLATKIPQIMLEMALVYLVVNFSRNQQLVYQTR